LVATPSRAGPHEQSREKPKRISEPYSTLEPARLHQIIKRGGMQVNQRLVWAKHSCAQVALPDRDIANEENFVVKRFHARRRACLLEQRVELPQVHVFKRCWTRLDRPRASNIEQHRTDRHSA